jgi:enterobacterial common antigen flippase
VPSDRCSASAAATVATSDVVAAAETTAATPTYGQILKSSAMIGGASMVNIAIGIVRTKAMALLLGPAGVGLMGVFQSTVDLALSVAAMGINSSGVRQIAEAAGSGNHERIAQTSAVLRRTAWVLSALGAVLMVALSREISFVTFGSHEHAVVIALLSMALVFRLFADAEAALIQGLRRIADLAMMNILGALAGSAISITLVFLLGNEGIVPAIVAVAAATTAASWWYGRKVRMEAPVMTAWQVRREASAMLRLGVAFMISGLLVMGTAYAVRAMILHRSGIDAAGLYQASWTLGGLYVGIILQALGADFYPRLTGVAGDNRACNRLVNEQAKVSLLLAGPGVIATITLAPLVVTLFYSAKFAEAVEILRWICLGMALRVVSWPMGFIILAKNAKRFFLASEIAWTAVHLSLAWVCIAHFGARGAGIAFFCSYVFHALMTYALVRLLSGFRFSAENTRDGPIVLSLIAVAFAGSSFLPYWWATGLGIVALLASAVFTIRAVSILFDEATVPPSLRRVLGLLRSVGLAS